MLIRSNSRIYVPFDHYYMQFLATPDGKVANSHGFALVAFRQAAQSEVPVDIDPTVDSYLVCRVDMSRLAEVSKSFAHLCAKNMDRTQVKKALDLLDTDTSSVSYSLPVDPLRFAVYLGLTLSDVQYIRHPSAKSIDRRVVLDLQDVAQATKNILIPQAEVASLQEAHLGTWLGVFPSVIALTGATTIFDVISAKVPEVSADVVYRVFQAWRDALAEITAQAYGLGITAFSINFPGMLRYEVTTQIAAKQQCVPVHKFTIDPSLSAQAKFLFSVTQSREEL